MRPKLQFNIAKCLTLYNLTFYILINTTFSDYTDNAARWQDSYETEDFEEVLEEQMEAIKPLFQQLHAYLRRQLWLSNGKDSEVIDLEGPIPASLLSKKLVVDISLLGYSI